MSQPTNTGQPATVPPTPENRAETSDELRGRYHAAMNSVARWARVTMARTKRPGELHGKSAEDMVEYRQHRQIILQRVEMNTLVALLIEKRVFSADEWALKAIEKSVEQDAIFAAEYPDVVFPDIGEI